MREDQLCGIDNDDTLEEPMVDQPLRVYVAGPMTGYADFNFPAFHEASAVLRELGHTVWSPAELDEAEGFEPSGDGELQDPGAYADFLSRDIKVIAENEVEAIIALPGWEDSGGAKTEVQFGRALGLHILSYPDLLPIPKPRQWLREQTDFTLAVPDEILHRETPGFWGERQAEPPPGEVRIVDADTGGAKGQKPQRMDLIPMPFLLELSTVYGEGAAKYADFNYLKGYDWKLSQGAMLRHIAAFSTGESFDPETGCHHLAHAAWHCATLFLFERYDLGKDHTLRAVLDGDVELNDEGEVA